MGGGFSFRLRLEDPSEPGVEQKSSIGSDAIGMPTMAGKNFLPKNIQTITFVAVNASLPL